MNPRRMTVMILILAGLLSTGCIGGGESTDTPTVELVYMSGCGNMPAALANKQLDAYIAWQPNVAIAQVAEIGKVLAYSKDLPPDGMWINHPCCVVHASDSFVEGHYDLATYLTMLVVVASDYVQEHPDIAAYDSAEWIFGNEPLTYGDTTVSSYDVEMASIPTIKFTTEPTQDWIDGLATFVHAAEDINMIEGILNGQSDDAIASILLHETLYDDAIALLESE